MKRNIINRILTYCWIRMSKLVKSDSLYLRIYYFLYTGRALNLYNPTRFGEKIQWLKLYNSSDVCSIMVDKYLVRQYVESKVGAEYLIPMIGIYDRWEDIDFDKLPNQFVIKTTHDSGGVVICQDKKTFDFANAESIIKKSFNFNFFWQGRERPYKNVRPRIIIEKFMKDDESNDLKDYKIWCFNGEPYIIQVDSQRYVYHRRNIYDVNWNKMPIRMWYPPKEEIDKKPCQLDIMLDFAKKMSQGFPFLRVDVYDVNNKIYFGELTFHPAGGVQPISPDEWDIKLGEKLLLPDRNFEI